MVVLVEREMVVMLVVLEREMRMVLVVLERELMVVLVVKRSSKPLSRPAGCCEGWSLSLYLLSLLSEPLGLSLLVPPQPLEVEEESPAVDAGSRPGPSRVKMTALWCVFT